jgi:exo-1,4-beta-D-glucosaminidase
MVLMKHRGALFFIWVAALSCAAAQSRRVITDNTRIDLDRGWAIQSSARVAQTGDAISTGGFDASGWYPARMPSTVISALVNNGVLPDPYFGINLRSFPGMTGDVGDNLTGLPMPPDSPFAVSWWYRTEFRVSRRMKGKRLWLNFDSINYRANIWLNGRQIAGADQVAGMYRGFEFDVTDAAVEGVNTLAVEVFPPQVDEFTITFVDWNPLPPDKDMGLVRDVYLRTSGPVAMRNVQVAARVESTLDQAHLTLFADLTNAGSQDVEGTLEGTIGAIQVSKPVRLAAGESARIAIDPEGWPQLNIRDPELWWPYGLGPQNLHRLRMEFRAGGAISDREDVQFGIREVTSELDAQQHRLFRINGRRILIRGAGWTHDMMLRVDPEREENEIRYARDMHLNTLRLEGKMLDDHLYDLADRYGILLMPGWCCCGYWEQTDRWSASDYTMAGELLRWQVRRLRNHPSVFVFLYGSDTAPNAQAERVYLNVLAGENWPNPSLASATDNTTAGAGRTGVKMRGPYAYVGPNYWLLDTDRGGAWGFATEIGPGHAIAVMESLRQMLPGEHLWPPDDYWIYHEATPTYPNLDEYTAALGARYGTAKNLADYVVKSQATAYESQRAMFEAYGRNKYTATGVIQWMFNNAWPSIVWHLYDWYLRPGGGYFGTKKANEPVHVQYSYDDGSIVVVNSLYRSFPGYSVTAKVYNMDLTEKYSRTAGVDIAEDSATRVFTLPQIDGLSRTYFVRLELHDDAGATAGTNFYWLSTRSDTYDWNNSNAWETPLTGYADLTDLENLPPAQVAAAWTSEAAGADRVDHITVRNPSPQLAFMVHLTVLNGKGGPDLAPVYWEDNYFELMPGEERSITATYPAKLLGGAQSYIQVDGWNVTQAPD